MPVPPPAIDRFPPGSEFFFLSNFWEPEDPELASELLIALGGYPTTEHAFQALKTLHLPSRDMFKEPGLTPGQAKRLGQKIARRPEWDEVIKYVAMTAVVEVKFSIPAIAKMLDATADRPLIEGNTWHDNTWGSCTCGGIRCEPIGQNHLGRMLARRRHINRALKDLGRGPLVVD
jgi:predicted NAD-dependent protein-ADP-ribosyltransferase YbiA (DUF1768 family)